MDQNKIRVRFAPSPTGNLHIGGLRTALFNWLYAQHNTGDFLIRIEDTDKERSKPEYTKSILNTLEWTSILPDEPIVFQSSRLQRHLELIDKLLKENKAYKCFCPATNSDSESNYTQYNKACRSKEPKKEDINKPFTIRFKIPDNIEKVEFTDLIRGHISIEKDQLDDFIILRSDGNPTYNFVVVVDDADMKITDVIRGEEHISNTPKQILLYRALDFKVPKFAHLPMILGSSGQKLSKREGATSVLDYKKNGYLPDALCNYLVRLGWSHGDQEIFTKEELVKYFSLDSVGKKGAIFDPDKLEWVNSVYIKNHDSKELYNYIVQYLDHDLNKDLKGWDYSKILEIISLYKDRSKTLCELIFNLKSIYNFTIKNFNSENLKGFDIGKIKEYLYLLEVALYQQEDFSLDNIKNIIKNICSNLNIKLPELAKPLRLALTGSQTSPGVFDLVYLLGKKESLKRINCFRESIR